jgi:P-type E1-E2 ATPase
VGDEVLSGTCNLSNTIDVRVEREESSGLTNHMSTLLRDAESKSARATGTADRWTRFVLPAAAIAAIATYLITNDGRLALTVMLLLCPCAFMLATPAVALAAAGGMARNGVILKDASAIEGMDRVDTVLFDKTGTLTTGVIRSLGFNNLSSDMPAEKIEGLVASLETYSEHPLGMAISTDHRHIGIVEEFHYIPGQGMVGTVDGISIAAGTAELMSSEAPDGLDAAVSMAREQPLTLVYVGIEGRCVGFFRLEDTLKNGARSTVQELRDMGLRTAMLTGDNKNVAQQVAGDLGIDLAVWDCRPETKLNSVENLEGAGRTCMIGDGMNDAPSLRRATVGIAMGVMGNDVSVK